MGRFYGVVGYTTGTNDHDEDGVWEYEVIEKTYYGDVLRNTRRWDQSSDKLNDELNVNNSISIIADAYAYDHFFNIKYVEWMDALWKVTNVEVQRPRLLLTIGGVYNGPRPTTRTTG